MKTAQIAKTPLGNTISKPKAPRSRSWCFTLNNYSENQITQLHTLFSNNEIEFIFQEEIGEKKTPHLQGTFKMKFGKTFSAVKKMIGINEIHLEKCRSWEQSIKYCSKQESRNGEIYTNINLENYKKRDFYWTVRLEYERNILDRSWHGWQNINSWTVEYP